MIHPGPSVHCVHILFLQWLRNTHLEEHTLLKKQNKRYINTHTKVQQHVRKAGCSPVLFHAKIIKVNSRKEHVIFNG